jgi:ribonuclease BN (tRNA processing enzyme)
MMSTLTFLGTGGGRYVLVSQRRHSGGIWLDFAEKMILDPGPGALVRALQYHKKPSELSAVIVSHKHLDHYNDAEIMIEAMTGGAKKKRGILAVNGNALDYISTYHRDVVNLIVPKAGDEFNVGKVRIIALPTHKHEEGTGFRFTAKDGVLAYSSDTGYAKELAEHYKKADVLILNVIFPRTKSLETHLNTFDAAKIIGEAAPRLAVIQHFGVTMLSAGPENEAAYIEKETGVRTIAATDGMTVDLSAADLHEKQLRL